MLSTGCCCHPARHLWGASRGDLGFWTNPPKLHPSRGDLQVSVEQQSSAFPPSWSSMDQLLGWPRAVPLSLCPFPVPPALVMPFPCSRPKSGFIEQTKYLRFVLVVGLVLFVLGWLVCFCWWLFCLFFNLFRKFWHILSLWGFSRVALLALCLLLFAFETDLTKDREFKLSRGAFPTLQGFQHHPRTCAGQGSTWQKGAWISLLLASLGFSCPSQSPLGSGFGGAHVLAGMLLLPGFPPAALPTGHFILAGSQRISQPLGLRWLFSFFLKFSFVF